MASNQKTKPMFTSLLLNTSLVAIEIIIGLLIGSLALIADGYKNLVDSLLLLVAIGAESVSLKSRRKRKKVMLFAATLNVLIILFVSIGLLHEAIERLKHPKPVHGFVVIVVALLAISINIIAALKIRKKQQIVTKAAYIALITSALSGACVLMSGILVYLFGFKWADGVAGLFVALLLFLIGMNLMRELLGAKFNTSKR